MAPSTRAAARWILRTDARERGTGSWFAGWDALAAALGGECLRIDATEALPASTSLLITTVRDDPGRVCAPTIYVAEAFEDAPVATLTIRSGTWFRRDLTLDALVRAAHRLAPASMRAPAVDGDAMDGDAWAVVRAAAPATEARIAHVGHRGAKVSADAVGFDTFRQHAGDWIAEPRDLWCCDSQQFDVVLLTPDWRQMLEPRVAINESLRILRVGGSLVIRDDAPDAVQAIVADAATTSDRGFLVTPKHAGRSWFVRAASRPTPAVSVLIVSEVQQPETLDIPRLRATIAAAHASLGDVPHEILVLVRHRADADSLAALRELAATIPECHLEVELAPDPLPRRLEKIRRVARGRRLLILGSGTVAVGAALRTLCRDADDADADAAVPRFVSPSGTGIDASQAPGSCLLIKADAWPPGTLDHSPYRTHELWNVWFDAPLVVDTAEVVSAGWGARPIQACGPGELAFDAGLAARRAAVTGSPTGGHALVVALRTMGDCILATALLPALNRRHRSVTVMAEGRFGWVFRRHPDVHEVLLAPDLDPEGLFWHEQELIAHVVEARQFDALVLLSDRLDNVPYFRTPSTFGEFYARQAGVERSDLETYYLALSADDRSSARRVLADHGVAGDYAVLHTVAGWQERTPPATLFAAIADHLSRSRGLAVVVVGGPGEWVDGEKIVNLAGATSVEVSAAIIAGARLFVGPDSGSMHMASALDIPTLGLYGGTGLRLVPPQARRHIAVQARTSCPRPCGLSPCAEPRCGAHGLTFAEVVVHLDALLDDTVVPSEWFAGQPASLIDGPEGPHVLQTDAALVALPSPPPAPGRPRQGDASNPRPRATVLPWRRDPLRSTMLQRRLLAMRGSGASGSAIDPDVFPLGWRGACLHSLALDSLALGDEPLAMHYVCAAITAAATSRESDRAQELAALRRTMANFSWPDRLRSALDKLESTPVPELGPDLVAHHTC
ncbi:MAG: glycosyltransferase family 9 protein [Planctomycetota bacterium]